MACVTVSCTKVNYVSINTICIIVLSLALIMSKKIAVLLFVVQPMSHPASEIAE